MSDAVLVAKKNRTQGIRKVVEILKEKKIFQAEALSKDYRPWGWFDQVASGHEFQVKRICVNPGASLSLQSHKFRSENWVVVEGTAKVIVEGISQIVSKGQSVHIPKGAKHRLENQKETPMLLIEVQTGSYLGEDDIIRYEDKYSRI